MLTIDRIDHIVLTVRSIQNTCHWYQKALNIQSETFGEQARTALNFGRYKINLHEVGSEIEPRAFDARAGSGDLCLISETPMNDIITHLELSAVSIELGPVTRTGATGELMSVYIRDPDQNLIEISNYI